MLRPSSLVWLLVAATVLFGALGNAGIAGGSDSYGYVSQADLWLRGSLRIEQPLAREVPWPFAQLTLTPLGYRPSTDNRAIVPVYAPGLPIIFAMLKRLAGQCAIRWVIPLAGGLLVAVTFGIGRLMFSEEIGAGAAWLVATSPTVLIMLAQPMSDIPVAACWGLAIYGCLVATRGGALLAGLAAATAVLIRPNLVHLGVLMGCWLAARDFARASRRLGPMRGCRAWGPFKPGRALIFGLPVVASGIAVAVINRRLYGSMTSSGYGDLRAIFSLDVAPGNLVRYSGWLIKTETPAALAGLVALVIPLGTLTKGRLSVAGRGLLAAMCLGVVACYLLWMEFDAWWYLRFLLPCWPAIFVSTAWLLSWPSGRTYGKPGSVLLLCLGLYGLWFSYTAGIFNPGEGDRRYAKVAKLVRDATPDNSLISSLQHSGSVRYYGGRMTLRYDYLNRNWLDPSVAWLSAHGVHPYFLLHESEVGAFRERFKTENALANLNVARVLEYDGKPKVYLFDPLQPDRPGEQTIFRAADVRLPACPGPASILPLVVRD